MSNLSKREALIDSAKTLLWERGYEAMSPKAVLKHSGAGQGSLYHHFEGKRDLAATALEEVSAQLREDYDALFDRATSPLKRIEAYLNFPREALKGCRFGRLSGESIMEDPVLGPIAADFFTHMETRLEDLIREAKQAGELPKSLKPKDTALSILAMVQGGYVLARTHQDPTYMDHAIKGAVSMFRELSKNTG